MISLTEAQTFDTYDSGRGTVKIFGERGKAIIQFSLSGEWDYTNQNVPTRGEIQVIVDLETGAAVGIKRTLKEPGSNMPDYPSPPSSDYDFDTVDGHRLKEQ